jgi:hypothetical protein
MLNIGHLILLILLILPHKIHSLKYICLFSHKFIALNLSFILPHSNEIMIYLIYHSKPILIYLNHLFSKIYPKIYPQKSDKINSIIFCLLNDFRENLSNNVHKLFSYSDKIHSYKHILYDFIHVLLLNNKILHFHLPYYCTYN